MNTRNAGRPRTKSLIVKTRSCSIKSNCSTKSKRSNASVRSGVTEDEDTMIWQYIASKIRSPRGKLQLFKEDADTWKDFKRLYRAHKPQHVYAERFDKVLVPKLERAFFGDHQKLDLFWALGLPITRSFLDKVEKSHKVKCDEQWYVVSYANMGEIEPNKGYGTPKALKGSVKRVAPVTTVKREEQYETPEPSQTLSEPIVPEEFDVPVSPEKHIEPVVPVTLVAPILSDKPSKLVKPVTPVKQASPAKPVSRVRRVSSVKPVARSRMVTPVTSGPLLPWNTFTGRRRPVVNYCEVDDDDDIEEIYATADHDNFVSDEDDKIWEFLNKEIRNSRSGDAIKYSITSATWRKYSQKHKTYNYKSKEYYRERFRYHLSRNLHLTSFDSLTKLELYWALGIVVNKTFLNSLKPFYDLTTDRKGCVLVYSKKNINLAKQNEVLEVEPKKRKYSSRKIKKEFLDEIPDDPKQSPRTVSQSADSQHDSFVANDNNKKKQSAVRQVEPSKRRFSCRKIKKEVPDELPEEKMLEDVPVPDQQPVQQSTDFEYENVQQNEVRHNENNDIEKNDEVLEAESTKSKFNCRNIKKEIPDEIPEEETFEDVPVPDQQPVQQSIDFEYENVQQNEVRHIENNNIEKNDEVLEAKSSKNTFNCRNVKQEVPDEIPEENMLEDVSVPNQQPVQQPIDVEYENVRQNEVRHIEHNNNIEKNDEALKAKSSESKFNCRNIKKEVPDETFEDVSMPDQQPVQHSIDFEYEDVRQHEVRHIESNNIEKNDEVLVAKSLENEFNCRNIKKETPDEIEEETFNDVSVPDQQHVQQSMDFEYESVQQKVESTENKFNFRNIKKEISDEIPQKTSEDIPGAFPHTVQESVDIECEIVQQSEGLEKSDEDLNAELSSIKFISHKIKQEPSDEIPDIIPDTVQKPSRQAIDYEYGDNWRNEIQFIEKNKKHEEQDDIDEVEPPKKKWSSLNIKSEILDEIPDEIPEVIPEPVQNLIDFEYEDNSRHNEVVSPIERKTDISKSLRKLSEEEGNSMWRFLRRKVRDPNTFKVRKLRLTEETWEEYRKENEINERTAASYAKHFKTVLAPNLHTCQLNVHAKIDLYWALTIRTNYDFLEKMEMSYNFTVNNRGYLEKYSKKTGEEKSKWWPNTIQFWNFVLEKSADSCGNIVPGKIETRNPSFWKEFKDRFKMRKTPEEVREYFMNNLVPNIEHFDVPHNTKVFLLYVLRIPISEQLLNICRQTSNIQISEDGIITKISHIKEEQISFSDSQTTHDTLSDADLPSTSRSSEEIRPRKIVKRPHSPHQSNAKKSAMIDLSRRPEESDTGLNAVQFLTAIKSFARSLGAPELDDCLKQLDETIQNVDGVEKIIPTDKINHILYIASSAVE